MYLGDGAFDRRRCLLIGSEIPGVARIRVVTGSSVISSYPYRPGDMNGRLVAGVPRYIFGMLPGETTENASSSSLGETTSSHRTASTFFDPNATTSSSGPTRSMTAFNSTAIDYVDLLLSPTAVLEDDVDGIVVDGLLPIATTKMMTTTTGGGLYVRRILDDNIDLVGFNGAASVGDDVGSGDVGDVVDVRSSYVGGDLLHILLCVFAAVLSTFIVCHFVVYCRDCIRRRGGGSTCRGRTRRRFNISSASSGGSGSGSNDGSADFRRGHRNGTGRSSDANTATPTSGNIESRWIRMSNPFQTTAAMTTTTTTTMTKSARRQSSVAAFGGTTVNPLPDLRSATAAAAAAVGDHQSRNSDLGYRSSSLSDSSFIYALSSFDSIDVSKKDRLNISGDGGSPPSSTDLSSWPSSSSSTSSSSALVPLSSTTSDASATVKDFRATADVKPSSEFVEVDLDRCDGTERQMGGVLRGTKDNGKKMRAWGSRDTDAFSKGEKYSATTDPSSSVDERRTSRQRLTSTPGDSTSSAADKKDGSKQETTSKYGGHVADKGGSGKDLSGYSTSVSVRTAGRSPSSDCGEDGVRK